MSIANSIRQCTARREQRRREAEKNGWQFPSPYDTYLCRDTEYLEYRRIWLAQNAHKAKVMQASLHISALAASKRAEFVSLQIPAGLPKPKDLIGRLVDWACRVVGNGR